MKTLNYLGAVKQPPIKDIAQEILDHLASKGMSLPAYDGYPDGVVWGFNAGGSEHGTGRALDFMIGSHPKIGDEIAKFVWANRRRYGLKWIIWKQRIRNPKIAGGKWRAMADRGSTTENHMDHPHIFFDGRLIDSGGTQDVPYDPPKPKEEYYQPVGVKMTVAQIQAAVKVTVDGYYGESTKAAVKKLQRKLDVPVDGYWGPVTEDAYEDSLNPKKEPGGARRAPKFVLPKGHWYGVESADPKNHSGYWPKDRDGIKRFQYRMKRVRGWRGMGAIDGVFGTKTEAVVKKFQRQKGLKVDGLVGIKTWKAAWEEPIT